MGIFELPKFSGTFLLTFYFNACFRMGCLLTARFRLTFTPFLFFSLRSKFRRRLFVLSFPPYLGFIHDGSVIIYLLLISIDSYLACFEMLPVRPFPFNDHAVQLFSRSFSFSVCGLSSLLKDNPGELE